MSARAAVRAGGRASRPGFRRAGAFLAALLAGLGVAGCASYDHLPVDPATGIRNLARVSDHLYRGGQPDTDGFVALEQMGIRTVVSLRVFNVDGSRLRGRDFRYVHISFKAYHPEDEDVLEFLQVVSDPANWPVFVHCKWGADRTGMMIAAYRMVVDGWSCDEAVDEMHRMGFNTDWDNLVDYLEHLDVSALRRELAETPLLAARARRSEAL